MNFNEYQELAKKTAIYPKTAKGLYPLIGLIGETAETLEKVIGNTDTLLKDSIQVGSVKLAKLSSIFSEIIRIGKDAESIKKDIRKNGLDTNVVLRFTPDHPQDFENVKKELGDVLWYIAAICSDFGFTMEEVAQMNCDKLKSRKERGVIEGSGDNR